MRGSRACTGRSRLRQPHRRPLGTGGDAFRCCLPGTLSGPQRRARPARVARPDTRAHKVSVPRRAAGVAWFVVVGVIVLAAYGVWSRALSAYVAAKIAEKVKAQDAAQK